MSVSDLEVQLATFGWSLKIPIAAVKTKKVDHIHILYVSYPDRIASPIREYPGYHNFKGNGRKIKAAQRKYQKQGFHTFATEGAADSFGNIEPFIFSHPVLLVETLLHEGFHNMKGPFHPLLEEAAACFVGFQASIDFFRLVGPQPYVHLAQKQQRNVYRRTQRFAKQYRHRQEELQSGVVINPERVKNNAYMLSESYPYLYYPLIARAHRNLGIIGETINVLCDLPKRLPYALRRLEKIANGS